MGRSVEAEGDPSPRPDWTPADVRAAGAAADPLAPARSSQAVTRRARPAPAPPHAPGDTPLVFDDAFLRRLERLSLRVRRIGQAVGGRPGTRRTPAADFVDHRAYSPGDDQRHIDWHAAARHDEVFVKVGREHQSAGVHVVLDVSTSMGAWPAKRRLSRELAAALGWLSLATGDRVTVVPFPEVPGAATWRMGGGTGLGTACVRYVAGLATAAEPATALAPAVRRATRHGGAGGLVVVISDLWLADDLETALAAAPPPRWDVLVLHVLDRAEISPGIDGPVELVDAESGARLVVTVDDALRAAYRAALNARLEQVRAAAGRHGAAYALVPADWPLERAVIPYLQRRSILA